MKRTRRSNGIAIAYVLTVLFVMTVLGFAFGSRGTLALNQIYGTRQYVTAFYAAQAGIMLAIEAEQQSDANLPTACGAKVSSNGTLPSGATRLNSLQGITLPYSLPNNAQFSITITNNTATPTQCSGNATAPDGTLVPAGSVYLTATGTFQGRTKTSNVMIPVTLGSGGSTPVNFNYAAFAQTTVTLGNNAMTQSYNSGAGTGTGWTATNQGNIGTNANTNGIVTLNNNVFVNGEVDVGPGGSAGAPTISAGNNATYNSAKVLSSAVTMPTVTDPNFSVWPPSGPPPVNITCGSSGCAPAVNPGTAYGTITVNDNASITLACGNFSMNSIYLGNNATLTVNCSSGQAALYVHGGSSITNPVNFNNNSTANNPGTPSALQIYDISSATGCSGNSRCTDTASNNATVNMAFYAPNANIMTQNNAVVSGSLIGYSVNLSNNATVSYDTQLANVQIGNGSSATPAVVGNFTIWNFQ